MGFKSAADHSACLMVFGAQGRVMSEWLKEREWTSCVYCGDGGGDFEGAMKVPAACGVILAKQGWALDQRLEAASPAAQVKTWTDQVAHHFNTTPHWGASCYLQTAPAVPGLKVPTGRSGE